MQYPVNLRFKLFTIATQIEIVDAKGDAVMFLKQKLFRLKERVEIYSDSTLQCKLFEINADRMIDFSACYRFRAADGTDWGAVRRRGFKSIWSAFYEIYGDEGVEMTIREENPWKRFLESVLGDLPIVGFFILYFLNPTYLISNPSQDLFRVIKKPSLFERNFYVERLVSSVEPDHELRALLALIMMTLLERRRG